MVLPALLPALLAGFGLAFARAVGEYGSVIFIAGNMPMVSEIAPLLIVMRLEQFDYAGAAAIGLAMLLLSFPVLLVLNLLQRALRRGRGMRAWACTAASAAQDPLLGRASAVAGLALLVGLLLLGLPLAAVFTEALRRGWAVAWDALAEPDTLAAIRLTLLVAAIAVPLNMVGGLAAAWCHRQARLPRQAAADHADRAALLGFPGHLRPGLRADLRPAGLARPLAAGARHPGDLRPAGHGAGDAVRHLPLRRPHRAAADAGAGARGGGGGGDARRQRLAEFRRVTLPNVKWALLSGVLLCNARAMGEFGAVSVVSGHIRGQTNTMPLHVEILYNEYQFAGAFAVAALLALLGLVTLAAKAVLERLTGRAAGGPA